VIVVVSYLPVLPEKQACAGNPLNATDFADHPTLAGQTAMAASINQTLATLVTNLAGPRREKSIDIGQRSGGTDLGSRV
jgi:hypothetical protein